MLSMTAPAGSLVKTTLVDFPGRVASAFFFIWMQSPLSLLLQ